MSAAPTPPLPPLGKFEHIRAGDGGTDFSVYAAHVTPLAAVLRLTANTGQSEFQVWLSTTQARALAASLVAHADAYDAAFSAGEIAA